MYEESKIPSALALRNYSLCLSSGIWPNTIAMEHPSTLLLCVDGRSMATVLDHRSTAISQTGDSSTQVKKIYQNLPMGSVNFVRKRNLP